jgi:hypothetical protein
VLSFANLVRPIMPLAGLLSQLALLVVALAEMLP